MLEKSIKKNLVETKEKKEKLLIERKLVESRIETLLGDVKTIKHFNNSNGLVEFFDKNTKITSLKTPRDYVFCARRVWDENTEYGTFQLLTLSEF